MSKVKAYFSIAGRKKMLVMMILLVLFMIMDGILTEYLIGGGKASEANPFLEPLIGQTGFMLLKIFGSLFCALVLWDVYTRHQRLAMVAAWIAVVGYGAIVAWNTSLVFLA
jgi:hypothetical protein